MAIAFVTGGTANGNAATSATVTISPSTTGGTGHDLFVSITLATKSAVVSSITATGGTATFGEISGAALNTGVTYLWGAINIGAGITSLTVNFNSSKFSIAAGEYSGIAQWNASNNNLSSSASPFSITQTIIRTGSYLLCAMGLVGTAATWSAGTNSTIDENGGNASQSGSTSTKCSGCLIRNTSTTASDLLQITVSGTESAASSAQVVFLELSPTADVVSGRAVQCGQAIVASGDSLVSGTAQKISVCLRLPTTTGNLLVAASQSHCSTALVTAISGGNTSFSRAGTVTADSLGTFCGQIYYSLNIPSITYQEVDQNINATTSVPTRLFVIEYSGAATTSPLDQATSSNGLLTTASSGATAATTKSNELVVGFVACETAGSLTAGSGYTLRQSQTEAGTEDELVTSTGAQTATFTLGSAGSWACLVATFIDASQPAVASPLPPLLDRHFRQRDPSVLVRM